MLKNRIDLKHFTFYVQIDIDSTIMEIAYVKYLFRG